MGQCVPSEVTVPAEHLATRRAFVRLVIRVREEVGLEVAALVETPGTDRTLVRGLLHVQDLVDRESTALAEAFAALAALEGFLLAVNVPGGEVERERSSR